MNTVDSLAPYCYPISYTVDQKKLNDSFIELLTRLDVVYTDDSRFAINLTHLPGLTGKNRWDNYSASHNILKQIGINETDFGEQLTETEDLYIGQVIKDIYNQHSGVFQGRCQLSFLGAGKFLPPHRDYHTTSRYHIPIVTNEECYWILANTDEKYKLHMPSDGKVWFLDPINIEHAFYNDSSKCRVHLLLTSGKD